MARFNIVLIGRPGYAMVTSAFLDVAELLQLSLRALGHDCETSRNAFHAGASNIVLGYAMLANREALAGFDCVIYQLEQLPGQAQAWLKLDDDKVALLRSVRSVWDFSNLNIRCLAGRGVEDVRRLPIGFHPDLARIVPTEPEIDVLFYGAINARRKAILDALGPHCRVRAVAGVYGARRDQLIARSRIVLNLRSSADASIMEQPRVAYLLNNRRFVVTEDAAVNPYGDAVVAVPYEGLVETCRRYLADEKGRRAMADRGYDLLAAQPMTQLLGAVLD